MSGQSPDSPIAMGETPLPPQGQEGDDRQEKVLARFGNPHAGGVPDRGLDNLKAFVLPNSLSRKTGEGFSRENIPVPAYLFGQVCGK